MNLDFSIIIATFNSKNILPKVLDSILAQNYPMEKLEILLIDGFSTDGTRELNKSYPMIKIIDNPKVDPVNAKYLGFTKSQGKYLIYLDHDEVLKKANSLKLKFDIFENHPEVMGLSTTGYENPGNYPFLNQYINDFGDPFSAYYYNLSKDYRFFIKSMREKYQVSYDSDDWVSFKFKTLNNLPIIELCAAGAAIRKDFLISQNISITDIPIIFKKIVKENKSWGITKNDSLVHYSSEQIAKYKNKIKWRIKNNIFHIDTIGKSGFSGRENDSTFDMKLKKLLFIPYNFLLLPVLIHSLILSIKHKSIGYIIHFYLSFYTACLIIFYMLIKVMGVKPELRSYDEKKIRPQT